MDELEKAPWCLTRMMLVFGRGCREGENSAVGGNVEVFVPQEHMTSRESMQVPFTSSKRTQSRLRTQ